MSWYGNTLIPTVQDTFWDCESYPVEPEEVAAAVADVQVADYIRKTYTKDSIGELYDLCGLTERAEQADRWNTNWK
jgi:hypothetical protein